MPQCPPLRAKQRQVPTRPPRTPTRTPPRTPVPDLGQSRARSSTAGLRPARPRSSHPRRLRRPGSPPTVTYRGRARHSTTHTPPDPTQIRPTGAARQDVDGHADISRPPRRQGPASTEKTPPPQERPHTPAGPVPTGQQTSELRSRRSARHHQTNGHRSPARSGDTGPHRRPPSGTRVLRVLPRVLRRVLRSLTWGFTPPTATPAGWSPTIRTFARRHRYPPTFTAVAAWSTALNSPTNCFPPAATGCPPHPFGPATGVLHCSDPAAAG